MATYKTANNLPIMEEVTENTYALVEENGTLKRVSGENLGGKSNFCTINCIMPEEVPSDATATSSSATYSCNMTYAELLECLQNKTLNGFSFNIYSGTNLMSGVILECYFGSDAPGIMLTCGGMGGSGTATLQFLADNTITEHIVES